MKQLIAIITIATIYSCSGPDATEAAIIEYEQRTPTGSVDRNIEVLSYSETGHILAADSIQVLDSLLHVFESSALSLMPSTLVTFDNEFKGTRLEGMYNRYMELQQNPDTVVHRQVTATFKADTPLGQRATITKQYIFSPGLDSIFRAVR